MKNSKRVIFMFILFVFLVICANAQPQRTRNRKADRHITGILQRLQRNSEVFRSNLNLALVNRHINQTRPQNDINSFEASLMNAINLFRDNFSRGLAVPAEVQQILEGAELVNGFMARNRLNKRVQNDWATVRSDLNALASANDISWQWNRRALPAINLSGLSLMSDADLNELIRLIEAGGDTFRLSLTDAFDWTPIAQATSDGDMNVAVLYFKNATDQLRNQFDAKQPVKDYVERLITRAIPVGAYMRNNALTNRAQSDWSALRQDLNRLAHAYDLRLI
ncbi:MAG TPA: hypothetical protein VN643_27395 [Pyrinomonadaceae bacterium]|nr:hypothetical protein [Pyrinomonadaceae bacterium]